MRNTWRHFMYNVQCQGCGFNTRGVNGLGLAAQHHDRTGHTISIDVTGSVQYASDEDHARLLKEKSTGDGVER